MGKKANRQTIKPFSANVLAKTIFKNIIREIELSKKLKMLWKK